MTASLPSMGRLVAIEGLDGAGKRTFADGVEKALLDNGAKVGRLAFPRYGRSVAADLVQAALYGRAKRLSDSVDGMAVLYALDRADARGDVRTALDAYDVVLLDRYVASNAAYGAARLGQDAAGDFVEWVQWLEIDQLGMCLPDIQLLLRVPGEIAAGRALRRAIEDAGRPRDNFEVDGELQSRTATVYDQLARRSWLSPWQVLDGASDCDHTTVAESLLS